MERYVVTLRPVGEHERRYNAPTVDEVAVVMVAEDLKKRDIIIQRRSENLQRISETHRSYDALQNHSISFTLSSIPNNAGYFS
jgi:hypothetical protein